MNFIGLLQNCELGQLSSKAYSDSAHFKAEAPQIDETRMTLVAEGSDFRIFVTEPNHKGSDMTGKRLSVHYIWGEGSHTPRTDPIKVFDAVQQAVEVGIGENKRRTGGITPPPPSPARSSTEAATAAAVA